MPKDPSVRCNLSFPEFIFNFDIMGTEFRSVNLITDAIIFL